jgi:hypothetical protein
MMKISDLKQEFQATELLSINEAYQVKGGIYLDDKRRQRPGGGTTTTSPNLIDGGGSRPNRRRFYVYQNVEATAHVNCHEL